MYAGLSVTPKLTGMKVHR